MENNQNHKKVAVVYLCWLPYGTDLFKAFLESYINHNPGCAHQLFIAYNGLKHGNDGHLKEFQKVLEEKKINNFKCLYFDEGQDIKIYKNVASSVDSCDHILFLNSYSVIKSDNWLTHFVSSYRDNVGLIGATGSYAGYIRSISLMTKNDLKSGMNFRLKFNKLKYLIKLFLFHYSEFNEFPNPHIRTNAFFINRELFCSLEYSDKDGKIFAYKFECGNNSMTRQVLSKGLECLIVDRNGISHKIGNWPKSNVFWQNNQENLLISDNQTRIYEDSDPQMKQFYSNLAWGKFHNL